MRHFDLFTLFGFKFKAEFGVIFLALFAVGYPNPVMALLALLLVIVIHELGHALLAKAFGAYVDSIVLGFGGQTLYSGNLNPGQQVVVSFAGPAFNLMTVPVAMVIGTGSSFGHALYIWSLVLAIFNLVPMLPLDGGHIVEHFFSGRLNPHAGRVIALKTTRVVAGIAVLACFVVPQLHGNILLLIFALMFGFSAHQELKTIGSYSSGAGMWQRFQQGREEKRKQEKVEHNMAVKARVDQLLAKISKEGMNALTDEERRFLNEASDSFK